MPTPEENLPEPGRELVRLLRALLAGRQPAAPPDWPALLQQAAWHGVDAFLYLPLAGLPAAGQPPAPVLEAWRRRFVAAAADAVRREAQTRELLAPLLAAQVRAVPLKGTWLAARVYADPAQRPMTDIDLLVPTQDLARAQEVLARLGYTRHGMVASRALDSDQTYTAPGCAWPLELHWQLGVAVQPPLHQPEISGLWGRLVPEPLFGLTFETLHPAEHLVHLAYHILHHRFALPLRAYLDLVLLGRFLGDRVDRAQLDAIAAAWGMSTALPRVTSVAHELFDLSPPSPLADWMTAADQPQRTRVVQAILASTAHRALPAERSLLAFQRRGPRARLALVLGRIFLPREVLRREYPCAGWWPGLPLAYLLRGRDLLRRNAGHVRRTLAHDPDLARQLDEAGAREEALCWALGTPGAVPPHHRGADAAGVTR